MLQVFEFLTAESWTASVCSTVVAVALALPSSCIVSMQLASQLLMLQGIGPDRRQLDRQHLQRCCSCCPGIGVFLLC